MELFLSSSQWLVSGAQYLCRKSWKERFFAGSFTFVVGNAPPRALAVPPPATKEREMRRRTDALKQSTCLIEMRPFVCCNCHTT
jgi:hypothetical protein